ncbi:MAG: TadE/TadG family type IV pilus assembly protein [Acidimicrobiales bacterium]
MLVEFALIAPLLFLIIFATIDFGWVFGQHLDVRHGAREGARLAAVNYASEESDQTGAIVDEICERMDANPDVMVALTLPGGASSGEELVVTVTRPAETLTGFVDFALGDTELSSSVNARIEQDATWTETSAEGQACT